MEVEKKNVKSKNEKTYKIFCESHRPFKIIQEIHDSNKKAVEDIQKFTKTIEKCLEIQKRYDAKPKKLLTKIEKSKMIKSAIQ